MTKRFLSMILALAMVLSLMPVVVLAEGAQEVTASPKAGTHTAAAHSAQCTAHCGGDATWTAWDGDVSKLAAGGHYYLTANTTLTGEVTVNADLHLCLNGYVLTAAANKRLLSTKADTAVELTISDCTAYTEGGKLYAGALTGGNDTSSTGGGALFIRREGVVNLYDIRIMNSVSKTTGGAVMMQAASGSLAGGKLTATGCEFSGNQAISGTTAKDGGAIRTSNGTELKLYDSVFTKNSGNNGGVIRAVDGAVTVDGCTFTGNTGVKGGVFYTSGKATLDITDSTFTGNTGSTAGAVMYMGGKTVTIRDSRITGNTSNHKTAGGAVYMGSTSCKLILGGEVYIAENTTPYTEDVVLYYADNDTIYVDGLAKDSYVEFSTPATANPAPKDLVAVEGTQDSWKLGWLAYRDANGDLKYIGRDDTGFIFVDELPVPHTHCVCGEASCTEHTQVTYEEWDGDAAKLAAGGKYYLGKDMQLTGEVAVTADLQLCLCGHTLTAAENSRHFSTAENANVTITIADCAAKTTDGVYTAGKLTGGNSAKDGGSIYMPKGNKLYIYDGILSGNQTAVAGGAIFLGSGAEGYLYGGLIEGNTATGNSGAIHTGAATVLTLDGVTIRNNVTKRYGGAIYVNSTAVLTVSGDTVITGNKRNSTTNNLHLAGTSLVNPVNLGDKALVGVTAGERAISGDTTDVSDKFRSDSADHQVIYKDGKLHYAEIVYHTHCVCGEASCTEHTQVTYEAWDGDAAKLAAGGKYYLTDDVALTGQVTVKADLDLCLCGYTLTAASGKRHFSTPENGNVTITISDCSAKTTDGVYTAGKLTGANSAYDGGVLYLHKTNKLYVYDGIFTGNTAAVAGGAIYVNTDAQCYLLGGVIENNHAVGNSGAVHAATGAKLTLQDVTIRNNSTERYGGAIYVNSTAELTVSGNTVITGNQRNTTTNNLHLAGTSLVNPVNLGDKALVGVTAGERAISGDTTDVSDKFRSDSADHQVIYKDGKLHYAAILRHTHCVCGEASCTEHTQVTYEEWDGDAAKLAAGGKYYLTKDVTLTGQVTVKADLDLCLCGYTLTAASGKRHFSTPENGNVTITISDCSAKTTDGVYTAGKLTGANSAYDGGVLYLHKTNKLYVYDGIFTGNTAAVAGGAIYVNTDAQCYLLGGIIENNHAVGNSGAVHTAAGAKLTLQDVTIRDNSTERYGGAVYVNSTAELTVSGDTVITGNQRNTTTNNLHLAGTSLVNPVNLGDKALVGVTAGERAISGDTADVSSKFFSDSPDYKVVHKDGKLHLVPSFEHIHCECGKTDCTDPAHEKISYRAWKETDSLPASGNYCLTQDVTISKEVTLKQDLNLCLCGHKVTGMTGNARFYSTAGSNNEVLTITDCTAQTLDGVYTAGGFFDNTYTNTGAAGGAFFIRAGGTLKLYEGVISGCVGAAGGAAIYAKNAEISVYNARITDNKAFYNDTWRNGGAFYLSGSALTVYGGEISGNEAANGAAIYTTGSCTLDIRGGSITGNITHGSSGAINVPATCTLKLSGNPVIMGNKLASGTAANVYLSDTGLMDVTGLQAEAKIGVSATAFRAITTETLDYTANFVSDDPKLKIIYKDKVLYTDAEGNHKHCLCGGSSAVGCDHSAVTYVEWDDPTRLPASGNYYLSVDVKVTKQSRVEKGALNLCLNGHTVQVDQQQTRIFYLDTEGILNISDCAGGGKLTGADRAAILTNSKGTDMQINLYGGELCGNRNVTSGGAIVAQGVCEFHMYGGKLSDNAVEASLILDENGKPVLDEKGNQTCNAANGGGLYVGPDATFDLYGGEISGNSAKEVNYVKADGSTTYAGGAGGAIYVRGIANLYGGKISGNTAKIGGGVTVYGKDAQLNVMGATVEKNTSSAGGGLISQGGSQINLKSGAVSGNTSTGNGGGIYVSTGTTLNMTGGTVSGNTAADGSKLKNGAGIYLLAATANISGGTISGHKAANGAGIYMCLSGERYPTLTVSGDAVLADNTATAAGGAISVTGAGATITMTGGTIKNNTAKNGGGVITQTKSAFTLQGGSITGNTSTSTGGGVYISTNTSFTMTGGAVDGNRSTGDCGGIVLLRSTATFKGGSVSNNVGNNHGGIRVSGATVTIHDLKLVGNKATGKLQEDGTYSGGNAGGLFAGQLTYTSGGEKRTATPKVTIYNIYAAGNSANNAGGAMLIQSAGTEFVMQGGTFTGNTAGGSGGAVYISTNVKATITGGSFTNNSAKAAGAINFLGCQADLSNVKIFENTVKSQGGACVIGRETAKVTMQNMQVYDNVSAGAAGAILVQSSADLKVSDSTFTGNRCETSGGAFYFGNPSTGSIENVMFEGNRSAGIGGALHIHANAVVSIDNSTIQGNTAEGEYGGGISSRGRTVLNNVKVLNNTAAVNGGGIGTGRANSVYLADENGLYATNVTITGNTAGNQGGAIYGHRGGPVYLTGCTITGNTAKSEGSGIFSDGRFSLVDTEVTGNTSEGSGYAIYMTPAEYDGHTYSTGFKKLGGNVIVRDNQGGDLYIGEGTGVAVVGETIGEKAHLEITLHSGVLSEHLFGVYHYEGGNLKYTVTAGDRSITDPEVFTYEPQTTEPAESAPTDDTAPAASADSEDNTLLYAGIAGIAAVVVLAAAVLVIAKKKKAGKAARQEEKE